MNLVKFQSMTTKEKSEWFVRKLIEFKFKSKVGVK